MLFKCKCKAEMIETVHFDYNNGSYEINVRCPVCNKQTTIYVTNQTKDVKMILNNNAKV